MTRGLVVFKATHFIKRLQVKLVAESKFNTVVLRWKQADKTEIYIRNWRTAPCTRRQISMGTPERRILV